MGGNCCKNAFGLAKEPQRKFDDGVQPWPGEYFSRAPAPAAASQQQETELLMLLQAGSPLQQTSSFAAATSGCSGFKGNSSSLLPNVSDISSSRNIGSASHLEEVFKQQQEQQQQQQQQQQPEKQQQAE